MLALSLLGIVAAGVVMGFQSPTNTELSRHIGNFQATVISFLGGTVFLGLMVLLLGSGDLSLITEVPFWQCLGGLYGVCVVLIITFAVPVLGIALTLTFLMFGQIIVGMIIDRFGLLLIEASELSGIRILGCVAVGIGIIFVYIGKRGAAGGNGSASRRIFMSLLSLMGGAAGGVQAPTNTALSATVGNVEASFVSFTGGLIAITVITLIIQKGSFRPIRGTETKPWMCLGGLYGAAAVFLTIITTPFLGVALMMAGTMLGQLACGLVIDGYGFFGSYKVKMNKWRYIGVAVIGIGIILVAYAKVI